jgi:hypothetical protein
MPASRRSRQLSNVRILQRQIEELALNSNMPPEQLSQQSEPLRGQLPLTPLRGQLPLTPLRAEQQSTGNGVVVPETKIKKRGIPKDVLINTKLLLT